MKKIFLALFVLAGYFASAQGPSSGSYPEINQGMNVLRLYTRSFHAPSGDGAVLATGAWNGSGALYYDSTGADSGLYVYHRPYWVLVGGGSGGSTIDTANHWINKIRDNATRDSLIYTINTTPFATKLVRGIDDVLKQAQTLAGNRTINAGGNLFYLSNFLQADFSSTASGDYMGQLRIIPNETYLGTNDASNNAINGLVTGIGVDANNLTYHADLFAGPLSAQNSIQLSERRIMLMADSIFTRRIIPSAGTSDSAWTRDWATGLMQYKKINGAGSGVTTVGSFSASSQPNGATIATTTITFGPVDGTNPGMMTSTMKARLDSNLYFVRPVTGIQVLHPISADSLRIKGLIAENGIIITNRGDTLNGIAADTSNYDQTKLVTNYRLDSAISTVSGSATFLKLAGSATATGAITGDLAGNVINISSGGNGFIGVDPTANAEESYIRAVNVTGTGNVSVFGPTTTATTADFNLRADYQNGTKAATITGNAQSGSSELNYIADTNRITGAIDITSLTHATLPSNKMMVWDTLTNRVASANALLVQLTSPTSGDVLQYNGTTWVNNPAAGLQTLQDVFDTESGTAVLTSNGTISFASSSVIFSQFSGAYTVNSINGVKIAQTENHSNPANPYIVNLVTQNGTNQLKTFHYQDSLLFQDGSTTRFKFMRSGAAKFSALGTATNDTTTYKPIGINQYGDLIPMTYWPGSGGGGGAGTVTSVDLGYGITGSNDPITTTGTVIADTTILATKGTAQVWSGAKNLTATPTFSTMTANNVLYAGTAGILSGSTNMTFSGTKLAIVGSATASTFQVGSLQMQSLGTNNDIIGSNIQYNSGFKAIVTGHTPMIYFPTGAVDIYASNASVSAGAAANHVAKIHVTSTGVAISSSATAITPSAALHLGNVITTAGSAPLKFFLTGAALLTTAEAGAVEAISDKIHYTITTGAARKEFTLNDAALTSGTVPVATTNGRLTDGLIISSGTYTPTLTNVTNITASTAYACQYLRVGNTVTVSGKVDIDVTLGAASELGMSLPIASAFTVEENLGGTGSSAAAASLVSAIRADATNDRAALVFTAVSLTNDSYFFEFTYQIK